MKTSYLLVALIFFSTELFSQDQSQYPYYVVVGGFAKLDNAVRFTAFLNKNSYHAEYAINPARQRYYVYILRTTSRNEAFELEGKIKTETAMKDAWVFRGQLGDGSLPSVTEVKPVIEVKIEEEKPTEVLQEEVKSDSVAIVSEEKVEEETPVVEEPPKPKPAGKAIVFKLLSAATNNQVNGNVKLQESDRATQYRRYKGNEIVYVVAPNNKSGRWITVVHVIGYQEFKGVVDYSNPLNGIADGSLGYEQEAIIPIKLERVKKGDYIELDSVTFFNNSAILSPTSVHELDQIVDLMNENQNYKIDIHGHVNGKDSREAISRGTSEEFFKLDEANNERKKVSSKELSKLRAEIVKDYLVSKGIDASKVAVTGDGYFGMIYPQKSTLAHLNDRVEIEITKD
ncbi:MAG: OmpA family protein [Flammeovirgaceae bacterium]|nr:OmpA family protein [Flammeovirgaceae bacterium]